MMLHIAITPIPNSSNTKYVGPDGSEGIYDSGGNLVTDPVNGGTYNFINADGFWGGVGHTIVDVVPYWFLGNSHDDPTSIGDRILGTYDGDTGVFYESRNSEH